MEPYSLDMDEKKSSTNIAILVLYTSVMAAMAYLLTKTTITILDFHAVTEIKDIEGLVDEVEDEAAED